MFSQADRIFNASMTKPGGKRINPRPELWTSEEDELAEFTFLEQMVNHLYPGVEKSQDFSAERYLMEMRWDMRVMMAKLHHDLPPIAEEEEKQEDMPAPPSEEEKERWGRKWYRTRCHFRRRMGPNFGLHPPIPEEDTFALISEEAFYLASLLEGEGEEEEEEEEVDWEHISQQANWLATIILQ